MLLTGIIMSWDKRMAVNYAK
ncbi:hypothetical protein ACR52K_16675, partial [Salmonella enterica]